MINMEEFEKTFAGLYFKDKKVQPLSYDARMNWGSLSVRLDYETKEGKQTEEIELGSALDLLAKRILTLESHFTDD